MLADTHCHLDFSDFDADRTEVIQRAREAGVSCFITIGTTLETSHNALALAEAHEDVYATVGIHPNEAGQLEDGYIELLRKLASHPKCAAIGEIGMDWHRLPTSHAMKENREPTDAEKQEEEKLVKAQRSSFRQMLALAAELKKNVVIHQRNCWEPLLELFLEETKSSGVRGVFHCFGGSMEEARELLDRGHYVSFTGIVTFKNARLVQETVAALPDGCFMVETDCPYLAPSPHRGTRCEPWHVRLVAEKIAELRNKSVEEIIALTGATTKEFFKLP